MSERPLSHTKRGKLLAALIGLVGGGPLGLVLAPLVLMLVNALKKRGNRFLAWGILGIFLAPLCWIPVVGIGIIKIAEYETNHPGKIDKELDEFYIELFGDGDPCGPGFSGPSDTVFKGDIERLKEEDKNPEWIACLERTGDWNSCDPKCFK